mgnify:CR=1 FL=1
MISFWVHGKPQTKGSARAFIVKGRAIITNDNPKAKAWQKQIALSAKVAGARPSGAAIALKITYFLARPKSHYDSKGRLKVGIFPWPTGRVGDIDKMERVVLDALTGIAYRDDSQVVSVDQTKQYGNAGWTGIKVSITEYQS